MACGPLSAWTWEAHVADDGVGDDRADAEDPGQAGSGGFHAAASFLLVARSWASRRRMSARNSAASSQRAVATASAGLTCSRMRAAWSVEISRE